MKNKKILIILAVAILTIIIFSIFLLGKSKSQKIGNNSSSQEIVDYILNISSYEATIEVETKSNKNSNKYILRQQYINDGTSTQEVLEPENIKGIKIIKTESNLRLENTNLNLSTILENYDYMADNVLDLNCFIEDYKNNSNSNYEEKDKQIIMKTETNNENKYTKNKTLYIDKTTGNPTKMEITDINQNTTIYILYKEVKINSLDKNNILAFNLYKINKEV
ncbi:MAG: hypothetical protein IKF38_04635 [Clostridia bacterium]|nr:hypothetical protein [Clostridia bacterium]